jgi:hypothetical protein
MVTCCAAATGDVDTAKVALDDPAVTVTLAGTAATVGSLLVSAMTAPPLGAGPVSVSVASAVLPPIKVEGLTVRELGVAGFTSRVAVLVTPRAVAEITTCTALATAFVETVKFALEEPALTFTLAGTVATAASLLVSVTTVPPLGAGPFRVTVACAGLPPITAVGARVREVGVAALTVSDALLLTPAYETVMETTVLLATGVVTTKKLAVFELAGTTTLLGAVATAGSPELMDTVRPPKGAGPVSVTVASDGVPPVTVKGENDSRLGVGGAISKVAIWVPPP